MPTTPSASSPPPDPAGRPRPDPQPSEHGRHPVEALLAPLGRALLRRRPDPATSIAGAPGLATGSRLTLTSTAFDEGGVIPARCCGWLIGAQVSPALTWSALPDGTTDLVLLLEDLDAPGRTPRVHTVAAFAPLDGGLPEGALTPDDGSIRFLAHRGRGRYRGPRPLPGHGPHRYRFHLYALDAHVDLTVVAGVDHLAQALSGHVLASGTLTGVRTS